MKKLMRKNLDSSITELDSEPTFIDWEFLDIATLLNEGHKGGVFTEKGVIYENKLAAQVAIELCLNHNQALAMSQKNKH